MITGFNTDIPYDGVTYHVQTEDKGLDTPLILSLVYVGGHIIASKRTPYADLISKGFDEKALTERLQRQHKLICAAIKQGRVEDLKRMSGPNGGPAPSEAEALAGGRKAAGPRRKKSDAPGEAAAPAADSAPSPPAQEAAPPAPPAPPAEATRAPKPAPPPPAPPQAKAAPPPAPKRSEPDIVILSTLADEMGALGDFRPAPPKQESAPPPAPAVPEAAPEPVPVEPLLVTEVIEEPGDASDDIYLSLLDDEGEFRAGQLVTIKIYVGRGTYGQRPVGEANLTVKVLGTSFRPLIVTTTTDEHGVGVVRALLPRFNSGRAAIIIRAVAGDNTAELRRIIHQ